jgi:hypothetical protein
LNIELLFDFGLVGGRGIYLLNIFIFFFWGRGNQIKMYKGPALLGSSKNYSPIFPPPFPNLALILAFRGTAMST